MATTFSALDSEQPPATRHALEAVFTAVEE